MASDRATIEVLLNEKRVFKPSKKFVEESNVKKWMNTHGIEDYDDLLEKAKDLEWFWGAMAEEFIEWYQPYEKVLEWDPPWAKWFIGAKYNIVHDALDRHVET